MKTDRPADPHLRLAMVTDSNTVRVELSGDLDTGSVALFHRSLGPLLAVEPEAVVIDLQDLEFLDCAGATALGRVAEVVVGRDGTVILRRPSDGVGQVLDRCGLGSIAGIEVRERHHSPGG